MNKSNLIQRMSELSELGLTKKQMEDALNCFMKTVEESLVNREKVQLIGFGSFETKERAARQGRNPRNPEEIIEIPSSIAPIFRPGKLLRQSVNHK